LNILLQSSDVKASWGPVGATEWRAGRTRAWVSGLRGWWHCRETFLGSPTKSVDVLSVFQEAPPREAEVQPLRSRAPRDILLDHDQQDLPQASLLEHFERTPLPCCPL